MSTKSRSGFYESGIQFVFLYWKMYISNTNQSVGRNLTESSQQVNNDPNNDLSLNQHTAFKRGYTVGVRE